jgi:Zn-dependent protease with chaperone function
VTLDFVLRGVVLALAAYAIVSLAGSFVIGVAWRRLVSGLLEDPAGHVRLLFLVRLLPAMVAAVVGFVAIPVSYLLWEPRIDDEDVGALALMLALVGAALVLSALWRTLRSLGQARAAARALRGAAGQRLDGLPLPAWRIDATFPVVALVGVWKPTLFVAESVIDACSPPELEAVVAHEMAHARNRDNLRRLVLRGAADALAWGAIGRRMECDWAFAAEVAADDRAGGDDPARHLALAAALVKVARLVTAPAPFPLPASALHDGEPVTARVKRLVERRPHPAAARPRSLVAGPLLMALVASLLLTPVLLPRLYSAMEQLIALGR